MQVVGARDGAAAVAAITERRDNKLDRRRRVKRAVAAAAAVRDSDNAPASIAGNLPDRPLEILSDVELYPVMTGRWPGRAGSQQRRAAAVAVRRRRCCCRRRRRRTRRENPSPCARRRPSRPRQQPDTDPCGGTAQRGIEDVRGDRGASSRSCCWCCSLDVRGESLGPKGGRRRGAEAVASASSAASTASRRRRRRR